MTRIEQTLRTLAPYDAFRWAEDLFEHRDYYSAAIVLQHLVDTHPDERDPQLLDNTIGRLIAERAKSAGISTVVFDRGGYAYHGRVAAIAEAAREAGLEF